MVVFFDDAYWNLNEPVRSKVARVEFMVNDGHKQRLWFSSSIETTEGCSNRPLLACFSFTLRPSYICINISRKYLAHPLFTLQTSQVTCHNIAGEPPIPTLHKYFLKTKKVESKWYLRRVRWRVFCSTRRNPLPCEWISHPYCVRRMFCQMNDIWSLTFVSNEIGWRKWKNAGRRGEKCSTPQGHYPRTPDSFTWLREAYFFLRECVKSELRHPSFNAWNRGKVF